MSNERGFENVELGVLGKKKKVPRRVIHFVSGETMEEYSTDEDEVDGLDKKDVLPTVDPVRCRSRLGLPSLVPSTLSGRGCLEFKPTTIHYDWWKTLFLHSMELFLRFSDLSQFCFFVAELVISVNLCEALVNPVFFCLFVCLFFVFCFSRQGFSV